MSNQQDAEKIWQTYTSSWSIGDERERNRVLAEVLVPDVEYTDPNIRTAGRDELSRYMAGFQQQVPGGSFRLRSFRFRSDESIAEWSMLDANGAVLAQGVSYGRYGGDGQLVKMAGFFPLEGQT